MEFETFLMKVNKVTAYHRHGNTIPKSALDDLSNAQIEMEAALSQPVAGVVESLALADKLYEAADALDAWLSTDDNFEGDVPDDVWVPLQKAMQDYEKASRIAPAPAVEPCKDKYMELIMAVGTKYPGESRHETALKYIRAAENRVDNQGADGQAPGKGADNG
jgi:hypothetical protein